MAAMKIFACMALCLLAGPLPAAQWYKHDDTVMGTAVHMEIWAETELRSRSLFQKVLAELHRIDVLMSHYKPQSELSGVNRLAGSQAVKVNPELFTVVKHALHMSVVTHGAFDITYASVGRFYDYRLKRKPNADTIERLLPAIDYHHVVLNEQDHSVRFSRPDVYIDLGGIAKGYAVDRAIALLQAAGVHHAYVSAGGDSRILGDKQGRPWLVGIQHPRDRKKLAASLPLRDAAISTSGDYERFFDENDVRYHHIIDPRTGISANRVRSVTVIGKACFTTDALSTGLFVLGVEKGMALAESLPDIEAVFIDRFGRLYASSGFVNKTPR